MPGSPTADMAEMERESDNVSLRLERRGCDGDGVLLGGMPIGFAAIPGRSTAFCWDDRATLSDTGPPGTLCVRRKLRGEGEIGVTSPIPGHSSF